MIEFKEGRYFCGIWFLGFGTNDAMFAIFTDEDHSVPCHWELRWRFRYYDEDYPGNEPFSGKDRKSGYSGRSESKLTGEEAKSKIETVISFVSQVNPPQEKFFCPMYTSDPKECVELLMKQPWAHMKAMSKEEFEKEYGEKGEKKDA